MHICPQEIAVILATVPAIRYMIAWLIRQRAFRVWWATQTGEITAHPTLHCASCHEEIKEEA